MAAAPSLFPLAVFLLFLLSFTSAQVASPQYSSYSSAPLNIWNWDTPASGPNNAPAGSGSFLRQGGHSGHYGLAFFRGGVVGTSYLPGTATLNMSVFSGDYLNLTSFPDSTGQLASTTWGGSVSFEVWVEFGSFRSWSRIFDWGSCGGCDNVLMTQNGRGGDNNSPSFSFHAANGGTTLAPQLVAGAGNVTDADYITNGPSIRTSECTSCVSSHSATPLTPLPWWLRTTRACSMERPVP